MLVVEDLTKHYGDYVGIDGLSFTVEAGRTVGLLGPNGAGKTTTMRLVTGVFEPTRGSIFLDGVSLTEDSVAGRRAIGYLPESAPLYGEMTVEAFLRFVADAKGVPRASRNPEIDAALAACDLLDVRRRRIGTLSKGYRQRVGLSQALLGDPKLLVLDEPTIGLDPRQTAEFRRLIQSLKGSRTIILSTHILPEVSALCDEVIIVNRGKLVAKDTPGGLLQQLGSVAGLRIRLRGPREGLLGFLEGIEGVASAELEEAGEELVARLRFEAGIDVSGVGARAGSEGGGGTGGGVRNALLSGLLAGGWDVLELSTAGAGLEEVFLHLVTEEEKE
jgi:ABC-2 type transport system ATP-binding protein